MRFIYINVVAKQKLSLQQYLSTFFDIVISMLCSDGKWAMNNTVGNCDNCTELVQRDRGMVYCNEQLI